MIPPVPPRDERIADRPLSERSTTPPGRAHDPTSDATPGADQYGDDVLIYVNDCLDRGSSPSEVAKSLLVHDFSDDEARRLVNQIVHYRRENNIQVANLSAGGDPALDGARRHMYFGAGIFVVGAVVTCGSLMLNASGGGKSIIAYGAIACGAIDFMAGATQYFRIKNSRS